MTRPGSSGSTEISATRAFPSPSTRSFTPKRNLATSVPVRGASTKMVSVRLSAAVPREMLFPVLAEIAKLRPEAPVRRGQVLIADVLGTGADVVATRHQGADSEERPSGARRSDSEPRS